MACETDCNWHEVHGQNVFSATGLLCPDLNLIILLTVAVLGGLKPPSGRAVGLIGFRRVAVRAALIFSRICSQLGVLSMDRTGINHAKFKLF